MRQVLDLLRRDVGRRLRRLCLDELIADHRDRLAHHAASSQFQIHVEVLADPHVGGFGLRLETDRRHDEVVVARRETAEDIRAVGAGAHRLDEAGGRADGVDPGVGDRTAVLLRHFAADGRGARRLRECAERCQHDE